MRGLFALTQIRDMKVIFLVITVIRGAITHCLADWDRLYHLAARVLRQLQTKTGSRTGQAVHIVIRNPAALANIAPGELSITVPPAQQHQAPVPYPYQTATFAPQDTDIPAANAQSVPRVRIRPVTAMPHAAHVPTKNQKTRHMWIRAQHQSRASSHAMPGTMAQPAAPAPPPHAQHVKRVTIAAAVNVPRAEKT